MSKKSCLVGLPNVILLLYVSLTAIAGSQTTVPLRLETKVNLVKKDRSVGGLVDTRVQYIGHRVDIRNAEQLRAFNGGKAVIMAFAEDVEERNESIVVSREEFDLNIEPLKNTSYETAQTKMKFDNVGYKYGHKYSGYLLVIKDANGATIKVSATTANIAKYATEALLLKPEDVFDKKFKFLKKGYLRD